jgi:Flp pilus assembly protein TadD
MGWLRIEGTAGKMLFDLHRYTESEKHLEVASKWGIRESTRVLAQIYAQGLGLSEKDPTRAQELEKLAARQETVKLNVPCDFRGTKAPFYIYAREWPAEYTRQFPGVNDQAKWLKEARNGIIPPKVVEAFERLQRFASDNDGFPHAVDEALSLEGTDSDAVDFAQRLFDGDRNATTLEIWRTAGKERYDYLVKKDRRSDANAVDNQLSEAADALLKQTKNDDSYRAAWKVFFAFGGHRSSTNVREARAASVRSAQLAELLPLDNPGDLARRMESYEQLGDADAGGDPQSAHDWYAKLLDAARARFSLKADAGGLKLLRIASTDLASILVKLKRPSDAEAVFKSLAAATDTLIGRSQSPDAIIEAFTVYARLVESERVLGNFAASQIDLSQERKLAPMIAAGTPDGELVRYKAFETLGDSLRVSGVPAEARESYAESAAALARYIVFLTASPARKADADDDELYEHYGSLSWILDEAGEFARAIEAAQSGLKLKPDAAYIEANLAHALLLSGKQQEAVSHYMKIRKSKVGSRGLLEATTEDFEILKQLGFADPEMDSILERMAQE